MTLLGKFLTSRVYVHLLSFPIYNDLLVKKKLAVFRRFSYPSFVCSPLEGLLGIAFGLEKRVPGLATYR